MGCCGQGRAALAASAPSGRAAGPASVPAPAPVPARAPAAASPAGATARLRYTERPRVRVRGPASGLDYVFSGDDPVQPVDARDAEPLVRTGFFRRAF